MIHKTKQKNTDFENFLKKIQGESEQKLRKKVLLNDWKTMSLAKKEKMALGRIKEFILKCKQENKNPIISFSGGKDSCVLKHLVHRIDKNVQCETAAELFHPEIAKFLKKSKTKIIKPVLTFDNVIKKYGFPIISKEVAQKINNVRTSKTLGNWTKACFGLRSSRAIPRKYLHFLDENFIKYNLSSKCCNLIKGAVKNSKAPKFIGTTIQESQLRRTSWLKHGCNFYSQKQYKSRPMSLWREEDVWSYIKKHNVKYSKAYDLGWQRTGCIACGFGLQFEQHLSKEYNKPSRFELLYKHYPNIYNKYMYEYNMALALADSGIELNADQRYIYIYKRQQKKIFNWYLNLKNNIYRILKQIEKRTNSKFTKFERLSIIKKYCSEKNG